MWVGNHGPECSIALRPIRRNAPLILSLNIFPRATHSQFLELSSMLLALASAPRIWGCQLPTNQAHPTMGQMLSAVVLHLGQGDSSPNINHNDNDNNNKNCLIFRHGFSPSVWCSALSTTTNPTKPVSISAGCLLPPRLCRVQRIWLRLQWPQIEPFMEQWHHLMSLSMASLSVWMNSCTISQALQSIAQTPGSPIPVSFAMPHFWQRTTHSRLNIHHQMSARPLPHICFPRFHSMQK